MLPASIVAPAPIVTPFKIAAPGPIHTSSPILIGRRSIGGRAFFAQQEVYDLLNLLRTLENPDDAVALAGTLRSPFGCLADDALILLAFHRSGLWAGLHDPECVASLPDDQRPRAERIRGLLKKWRPLNSG